MHSCCFVLLRCLFVCVFVIYYSLNIFPLCVFVCIYLFITTLISRYFSACPSYALFFFFIRMLIFRPRLNTLIFCDFRLKIFFYFSLIIKLTTYNSIVFTDFQHTKLHPFQNLSLGFILKIYLKFRQLQSRYYYKIHSYIKKSV